MNLQPPLPTAISLPKPSIGIVYCTSNLTAKSRDTEKVADCEVIEVARATQAVLETNGYRVDLIDLDPARIADLQAYDWIFNLAETIYGFPLADDEVAEALEGLNLGFTGAGSSCLKTCRDKAFTKTELSHYGVLTPAYEVYTNDLPVRTRLSFPLMVKPLYEDGSIGIHRYSRVTNTVDLVSAVQQVYEKYQQPALVEEFIEGRDITASILGNDEEAVVLPLSEVTYRGAGSVGFLTFDAKWDPDSIDYHTSPCQCPCELQWEAEEVIREFALRAFRIMGCRDYARVDFRLKGKYPYLLEVNPNPCINPNDSGFVRCAKAAGYSYEALILRILECSVRRQPCSSGLAQQEIAVLVA